MQLKAAELLALVIGEAAEAGDYQKAAGYISQPVQMPAKMLRPQNLQATLQGMKMSGDMHQAAAATKLAATVERAR